MAIKYLVKYSSKVIISTLSFQEKREFLRKLSSRAVKKLLRRRVTRELVKYLYPPKDHRSFNAISTNIHTICNIRNNAPFTLTFLISMPRSGSTLLQKLLSNHPKIHSYSEGWLLLPLIYLPASNSITRAVWEQTSVTRAIAEQTELLEDKMDGYYRGVRSMVFSFYGEILKHTNKEIFIDKTPSYYMISNELRKVFPESKQIILTRHPLDIISSMLTTWLMKNLLYAYQHKDTLIYGPPRIKEAKGRGEYVVRYEDMVTDTENVLKQTLAILNLNYSNSFLQYDNKFIKSMLGDNEGIYRDTKANTLSVGKWKEKTVDPQYWKIFWDYLNYLGEDLFLSLGYDFREAYHFLNNNRPAPSKLKNVQSLRQLLSRKEGANI